MKTKEFIKKVKELGFKVVINDNYYEIRDKYNYNIAIIDKTKSAKMSNYYNTWSLVNDEYKIKIFNLLIEFAATPIEDREEEKKFYLRHKFLYTNAGTTSSDNYLNYRNIDNSYFLHDSIQNEDVNTLFTLKEIEEIKEKFDTDLADFELVEVK